jgi:hypothetical protein
MKGENMFENDMSTPIHRALHYVECYALFFPHSGAKDVAQELLSLLTEERSTPHAPDPPKRCPKCGIGHAINDDGFCLECGSAGR